MINQLKEELITDPEFKLDSNTVNRSKFIELSKEDVEDILDEIGLPDHVMEQFDTDDDVPLN